MKAILIAMLIPSIVFADCDFSTIVKDGSDYRYSAQCHQAVGKMKEDIKDYQDEVGHLKKTISLKDLDLDIQKKTTDVYRSALGPLEDRVNSIEQGRRTSEQLHFVAGVALTALAIWAASQIRAP